MRHGKKINHLGRTAPHRKAMLSNMATSLIQNKRIVTTVAKAKALRKYVEPIITRSKTDTTHSRRMVFRYLQDKESVNILFNDVSEKVANREGGYTRILKTGNRLGDNASMCVIELVDYNEALLKDAKPKRSRTRRSRRGKGSGEEATAAAAAAAVATEAAVAEEAIDSVTEEAVADESTEAPAVETAEETSEEVVEATSAETTEETEEEQAVEQTEEQAEETADEQEEKPVAEDKAAADEATEQADDTESGNEEE